MKNKVIVKKINDDVKFYLKNDDGEFWLFTQPYSKPVYEWFRGGRAEKEIVTFDKWNKGRKLRNTVERIPREIKYVTKYIIPDEIAS